MVFISSRKCIDKSCINQTYDYYCFITDIPALVAPLTISSTTTESIVVSWTAPEPPVTGYTLSIACVLLCGVPVPAPSIPITTNYSISATFSNIPPASECDITLTAQYRTASSNELMVTATTLSESEYLLVYSIIKNVHVCDT